MITDLPSASDFEHSGYAYLNLAWDTVLGLIRSLEEIQDYAIEAELMNLSLIPDDYWNAAQPELATSVSLLQQAVEFLLKGRIASVSPYLLLDGTPRDWPRRCDQLDTPFSNFRTIDSHELLRAHDAVCTPRLPDAFHGAFDRMRKRRNGVIHTVDVRRRFLPEDVMVDVLEVCESFAGAKQWRKVRLSSLEMQPVAAAIDDFNPLPQLAREWQLVFDRLPNRHVKRHFHFEPRQRKYTCYSLECADADVEMALAQLDPNTPTSTSLYCCICDTVNEVVRQDCSDQDCMGNVLDAGDLVCLTCGADAQQAAAANGPKGRPAR